MRAAWLLLLAAGCGSSAPVPAALATRVSLVAPPEGKDDVVVATVNGRPVWGSCVAHQGNLADCIDFELLAQAAEARGLAGDREVASALDTALANRLVEAKYEDKYRVPSDFGPIIDKVVDDNARQLHRPEYRSSAYLRVVLDPQAPPDKVAAAEAVATKLAAALQGEHGLLPAHVAAYADRFRGEVASAGFALDEADAGSHMRTGLVAPYANALWAIGAIGDAAPAPVRTPWGWDVIVWTDGSAPMDSTRAQLAAEVFPNLRRSYFDVWARAIEKALGVHIERYEDNIAKLDKLPVLGIQQ